MAEQFITYFGYGSLVNRDTRPPAEQSHSARLHGWQRVWGHRVYGSDKVHADARLSCCSLSVEKVSGQAQDSAFIDGVVVSIPLADLPLLDERETGYDRIELPASAFELPSHCTAEHIYMYVSDQTHSGFSNEQFPILQSYVDCVLAGYCAVFERSGMQHFIDTTQGWDGVIKNDRESPQYPRAVKLPQSQLTLFDDVINARRTQSSS